MDEAGILIWHDLMFACALYPSSTEILANIEAEMRDNVKRIRNHPSIGLWNGNNEVWIGWLEWGWQSGLSDTQKKQVEQMYNDVFKGVLPKVLKEEHPEVYYWETSPSVSSSSTKTLSSGDIHFWRVWAAGSPIEEYEEYVGRFNSEYGMQALPDMSTLQRFTRPEDLDYPTSNDSYVMRLH
jgi:beta-mannosidase